jgi:hydroxypyruvate isomerase
MSKSEMSLKRAPHGPLSRRALLAGAAGALAATATGLPRTSRGAEQDRGGRAITNGRLKQSVCQWCFNPMPLDALAAQAAALGLRSVELVDSKDWPILKRHGLICAMANSHGFVRGFNHRENHAWCIDILRRRIDECRAAGFPSVITFSGYRKGMPDDVGLENTVEGLKQIVGYAEKKKVNLCIEVLNSRVHVEMKGHPDYMCDKVEWAVEVCRRIASERMKILFDIYHVQIMEGDLIARIRQYHQYVGHYHTAGVPGRNEIDVAQEINYPAVMKAIVATGYDGYVGQEFVPTREPMQSLRAAVTLCDV